MYLPLDYPRINQFPEWFTVSATQKYEVKVGEEPALIVEGAELYQFPVTIKAHEFLRLMVKAYEDPAAPKLRTMKYTPRSPQKAVAWQKDLRRRFHSLLKLEDLLSAKIPLAPQRLSSEKRPGYVFQEAELNSTPGRRIKAVVTLPQSGPPPYPAVVCIHGHGGSRHVVYDKSNVYKGFASALADFYSLIAPGPLQCQNGLAEVPTMFVVPLARQAMKEIRLIYTDLGNPGNVSLAVHRGEHEVDLPGLLEFFETHLKKR